VADEATARQMPLYVVGGFVRDLLLGRPGLDFDLVVEGDAIALVQALVAKYGGKVTAHTRFGTAQWFLWDSKFTFNEPSEDEGSRILYAEYLDFISARSEIYVHPGALPTVKRGTIADDLRRRDFTINTLALRLDGDHFGELRDDFGGMNDLKQGIVRSLHPRSYSDDPTRTLRAVRYEQRYDFQIAAADIDSIAAAIPLLSDLSGERLRHELDLILAEGKCAAILARLAGLDILGAIHPSLVWDESLRLSLNKLNQPEPEVWRGIPSLPGLPKRVALGYLIWFGRLSLSEIESLASRLAITAGLRDALLAFSTLRIDLPTLVGAKPSVITARLVKVPLLAVCAFSLASFDKSSSICESAIESINKYLSNWRYIKPKTTGNKLKKLGLPPGPAYRTILRRLGDAWLDGEINTSHQEKELLNRLLENLND
jgi:tRNA nucleotidyltransferase (CCA-adding enzyme)